MTSEDRSEHRLKRIIEVQGTHEGTDATAPSTARALAAAGVTVVVVAVILSGAPVLAAGLLLVALAVAIATTADDVPDASATVRPLGIEGRIAECRAWLSKVRSEIA